MKLMHLSDLHIGKRIHEVSMLEDQDYILREILQILDREHPDAVIIAGDVYDKSVPSAEAVTLFDNFLCRLQKRGIPVLIISGNHDSAERLAFGGRLMNTMGVHFSPVYNGRVEPVILHDEFGDVRLYMLPFLKPTHVRHAFPDAEIDSYTDAVKIAVDAMNVDPTARNVLITHQFVTGAVACESEELSVGGADNVSAAVFDAFDYVALGHIHGPQNILSPRIRYCGTPLKYSFSEAGHHKSVTMATLGDKGELSLSLCPLTPKHDLRELRGTFAQLTDKAFYDTVVTDDYLHIILTDEEDVAEAIGRLRVIYPNILKLSYDNTRTRRDGAVDRAENVERKSPLTLFEELYTAQNNRPLSDEQRDFVAALITEIWEEDA